MSFMFDDSVATQVRVWMFGSFFVSFGSLVAALWIMAAKFLPPANTGDSAGQWAGISIVVQCSLILASSMTMLFGKKKSDEYESV
jgi:hypothetical protein